MIPGVRVFTTPIQLLRAGTDLASMGNEVPKQPRHFCMPRFSFVLVSYLAIMVSLKNIRTRFGLGLKEGKQRRILLGLFCLGMHLVQRFHNGVEKQLISSLLYPVNWIFD